MGWDRKPPDVYILQYCINTVSFSPLQVKHKPRQGVMNVHLFLDLLAHKYCIIDKELSLRF
jgi:hypothetical protein